MKYLAVSRISGAAIAGMIFGILAFVVFLRAEDDFSYDYMAYLFFFDRLADLSAKDLVQSVQALLPLPYVLIPPRAQLEVGFVAVVWTLLSIGFESATVYALIGALSIAVRVVLLRKMGMGWPLNAALAVYSITLFEANAIRLGCAVTLTIGALLMLLRSRPFVATGLMAISALFHLQALVLSVPVLAIWAAFKLINGSKVSRAVVLMVTIGLSAISTVILQSSMFGKVEEYAGRTSAALGFTSISAAGLIALILGAAVFLRGVRSAPEAAGYRVWGSVYLSACPALAILLLATNMGGVGVRVWQMAFVALIAVYPFTPRSNIFTQLYRMALLSCLAISIINITIRYPLSNFFAPLIPHSPITKEEVE